MTIGLLGKKLGMMSIYDKENNIISVTLVQIGPCYVLQIKEKDKDGYSAVQLGFDKQKARRVTLPELIHTQKAYGINKEEVKKKLNDKEKNKEIFGFRMTREIRDFNLADVKLGTELKADIFKEDDIVQVTGYSKGKGFQGVMKRYHFKGGPATHGAKFHRGLGSTGQSSQPSKVFKGKKMPGRMGHTKVTVKGLKIVKIDVENNLIYLDGCIPGSKNSYLIIKKK
jgi:large subunit ribosomal protein L3